MKLKELVADYGANGFVFADQGSGSSFGEKGCFVTWDAETEAEYGNVDLVALEQPHHSEDGCECNYASEWIEQDKGGYLTGYRYRLYF